MEFELDNGNATYRIQSYKDRQLKVNNLTYDYPILVMPDLLIAPWGPDNFESLTPEHFKMLLPYKLQVVILGTGPDLKFPSPKLYEALTNAQIGVEIMNTSAACRTYTLLMAEGRSVACALFC